MNKILRSHEISGVLNKFFDTADRTEKYYCAGISDEKDRNIAKSNLENFKLVEWIRKNYIIEMFNEEISKLDSCLSVGLPEGADTSSITHSLQVLLELKSKILELKNE